MSVPFSCIAGLTLLLTATEPQGHWRGWLGSPGGALPFELELTRTDHGWRGWLINGPERIEIPTVTWSSSKLVLDIDYYDSKLTLEPADGGARLEGSWRKRRRQQWEDMPVQATRGNGPRFAADAGGLSAQRPNESGGVLAPRYRVQFSSSSDPAVALFETRPGGVAWGTFMTTTGDYRYLAGDFDGRQLRLSVFDGAHAFLFTAVVNPDGSLSGDFWSGSRWHDTWTAVPDARIRLPDAFGQTRWTGRVPLAQLAFPDLDGRPRALADPAFAGKARIIEIFGSWCPNCRDATSLLVELDRRYHSRGLRIVGLAFEHTGDLDRDSAQVRTYARRHGITYPLLIAGTSEKKAATEAFPALDRIRSYPTTIFLDDRGEVRAVHTGFTGPATGDAYVEMRTEFERLIEELLDD